MPQLWAVPTLYPDVGVRAVLTASGWRRSWLGTAGVVFCLAAAAPAHGAPQASPFLDPLESPRAASAGAPPAQSASADDAIKSNERGTTYWSRVLRATAVRKKPSSRAARVGRVRPFTYYGLDEVVIVLEQRTTWSRVRYSGTGRRTGWVPTSALSRPRLTDSWVVIDKDRRRLHVYRGKRKVVSARVGIGARGSPTPGGRFFIRERLVPANKRGIYGILAFGLSAYSRHRTDWPGGGQVGIHGTNQPGLIPGRISNGCVRLKNADVRRIDRHIGRGTPVRIR